MAPVEIRPVSPEDAADCGTVIYTAFCDIAARHGYPPDFPSREVANQITSLAENIRRTSKLLCAKETPAIVSNAAIPNRNVTFLEWLNRQPGFKGQVAAVASWDVFLAILNPARSGYTGERLSAAYRELLDRLAAKPLEKMRPVIEIGQTFRERLGIIRLIGQCSNEWLNGGLEILHTNVGASEVEERLRVVGLLSDCLVKRCYCFVVLSGIGIHDADLVIGTRKLWVEINGPLQMNNCLIVLSA